MLCESDSQDEFTALIQAAGNGRAECARLLIDAGADKEARDRVRVGRCFAGMLFCFNFQFTDVSLFALFYFSIYLAAFIAFAF